MQKLYAILILTQLLGNDGLASGGAAPHVYDDESTIEVSLPSPEERLSEAVRVYQTGAPKDAQVLLARIVNDPSYEDEPLRQRARVFLGEVLYLQQSEEEARRVFETVLTLEPNYIIDPFQHPPDVCGFFETIRAYIRPNEEVDAVLTAPVPPTPFNAYLGFGIYQLRHKERSLGTSMAIGQTTFGIMSAAMFLGLLNDRGFTVGVDEERRAVKTRKITQWASTTGFYGFWAWSAIDANRHWRTNVEMHNVSSLSANPSSKRPSGFRVQFTFPTP